MKPNNVKVRVTRLGADRADTNISDCYGFRITGVQRMKEYGLIEVIRLWWDWRKHVKSSIRFDSVKGFPQYLIDAEKKKVGRILWDEAEHGNES